MPAERTFFVVQSFATGSPLFTAPFPMMNRRTLAILAAAACTAAVPATAQQPSFGPSAEAGLGHFVGGGGQFFRRGGPAVDAVLAVPVGRAAGGTIVAGVTAGISGTMGGDLICEPDPEGNCKPDYPAFFALGAVAGVQRQMGSGLSARALAGPAYYQSADGPNVWAFQGRVDVAKPLVFHTALVLSLRGAVLPSYQGEALSFTSLGLGLRIQ